MISSLLQNDSFESRVLKQDQQEKLPDGGSVNSAQP